MKAYRTLCVCSALLQLPAFFYFYFLFLGTLKGPQYVCNAIAAQSAWGPGANVPKCYEASHQLLQDVAVPRKIGD